MWKLHIKGSFFLAIVSLLYLVGCSRDSINNPQRVLPSGTKPAAKFDVLRIDNELELAYNEVYPDAQSIKLTTISPTSNADRVKTDWAILPERPATSSPLLLRVGNFLYVCYASDSELLLTRGSVYGGRSGARKSRVTWEVIPIMQCYSMVPVDIDLAEGQLLVTYIDFRAYTLGVAYATYEKEMKYKEWQITDLMPLGSTEVTRFDTHSVAIDKGMLIVSQRKVGDQWQLVCIPTYLENDNLEVGKLEVIESMRERGRISKILRLEEDIVVTFINASTNSLCLARRKDESTLSAEWTTIVILSGEVAENSQLSSDVNDKGDIVTVFVDRNEEVVLSVTKEELAGRYLVDYKKAIMRISGDRQFVNPILVLNENTLSVVYHQMDPVSTLMLFNSRLE
jgi:hypothetical protein